MENKMLFSPLVIEDYETLENTELAEALKVVINIATATWISLPLIRHPEMLDYLSKLLK